MDPGKRPPLVLVHGSPASGKTTLSNLLGEYLKLPVISRDVLKEAMAERQPPENFAEAERFGMPSVGVFYSIARSILIAGTGVVLDNVFPPGAVEEDLRPLIGTSRAVQVYCSVPREDVVRRYVARHERGERHASHFDADRIARVLSGERKIDWSRYEPLELGIPTLHVDTTSGHKPSLSEIIAFIRREALDEAQPAPIEYPKRHLGTGALFFNASGELLIVKPTYRDFWSIPGGVAESNESPLAACAREVREEIGLDVPIGPLLVLDHTSARDTIRESLQLTFDGGVLDEETIAHITLPPAELSAFRFVPLEEAKSILNPRITRRLPHALDALRTGRTAYLEDGEPVPAT